MIPQTSFFIHFNELLPLALTEGLAFILSCVLETGIREQEKYEKRKQTSMDNTLNDLHHESLKIV